MCIIIDTNTLGLVFNKDSEKHDEFVDVLDWIFKGKGKIIYGGTKYLTELSKAKHYNKLFSIFSTYGKAINIDKDKIDFEQNRIEKLITDPDFDDPHLPAIAIVSKCRLICSYDKRSIKFVTDKKLYPKNFKTPNYYTGKHNKSLLSDRYIDDCYKPLCKLTKEQSAALTNIFKL